MMQSRLKSLRAKYKALPQEPEEPTPPPTPRTEAPKPTEFKAKPLKLNPKPEPTQLPKKPPQEPPPIGGRVIRASELTPPTPEVKQPEPYTYEPEREEIQLEEPEALPIPVPPEESVEFPEPTQPSVRWGSGKTKAGLIQSVANLTANSPYKYKFKPYLIRGDDELSHHESWGWGAGAQEIVDRLIQRIADNSSADFLDEDRVDDHISGLIDLVKQQANIHTDGEHQQQASRLALTMETLRAASHAPESVRKNLENIALDIESRGAWEELPVLADALEEAGYPSEGHLTQRLRGEEDPRRDVIRDMQDHLIDRYGGDDVPENEESRLSGLLQRIDENTELSDQDIDDILYLAEGAVQSTEDPAIPNLPERAAEIVRDIVGRSTAKLSNLTDKLASLHESGENVDWSTGGGGERYYSPPREARSAPALMENPRSIEEAARPQLPEDFHLGEGPLEGANIEEKLKNFPEADLLIKSLLTPEAAEIHRDHFKAKQAYDNIGEKLKDVVTRYGDRHDKAEELRSRWYEARKELDKYTEKVETIAEEARQAIKKACAKEGQHTPLRDTSRGENLWPEVRENLNTAINWLTHTFRKIPGGTRIPSFTTDQKEKDEKGSYGRAEYRPRESRILLPPWVKSGTIVHEMVHHLEKHDPSFRQAVLEFANHRFGDEVFVDLPAFFPEYDYPPGIEGRKDKLDKYFPERLAYYAGVDYGDGSEFATVILTAIYEDALGFAEAEPEAFKWGMGVLSGRLRGSVELPSPEIEWPPK